MELFRPLPTQTGHFNRINAMPSDFPLMSTGWAIYPVPPQRGQQLFGSTRPPRLQGVFHQFVRVAIKSELCYETRTKDGVIVCEGFRPPLQDAT
jgi:hypothetical protein